MLPTQDKLVNILNNCIINYTVAYIINEKTIMNREGERLHRGKLRNVLINKQAEVILATHQTGYKQPGYQVEGTTT